MLQEAYSTSFAKLDTHKKSHNSLTNALLENKS
jgi:hypothetical protein